MKINLSKIKKDPSGRIEAPTLILKTLHEKIISPIYGYYNLKISLKYNELSEVTFDVPSVIDGIKNPVYDSISGFRMVEIEPYGKFILMNPERKSDGIKDYKSCVAYSLEYEFTKTTLILEEGTYNLYNPADNKETLVGLVCAAMPSWGVGYVSPTLYGKYRTFDSTYDENILDFLLGTAQKSYRCLFIFDSNTRTFDVLDADDDVVMRPIYLSADNYLKQISEEELSDGVFTALNVYGADPVSIRNVNPTGSNIIYNLDWFIETGDIDSALAERWRSWEKLVDSYKKSYGELSALRNAESARLIAAQAILVDLEGELTSLENLRDVIAQGVEIGAKEEEDLDKAKSDVSSKKKEIKNQESKIDEIKASVDSFNKQIQTITNSCKMSAFFTSDEFKILQQYFIQSDFVDETYAIFDVDISGDSDKFSKGTTGHLSISGGEIVEVEMQPEQECRLFSVVGGRITLSFNGSGSTSTSIQADIIDGTIERRNSGDTVASFYLGSGSIDNDNFPSGTLTIVGDSSLTSGSNISFSTINVYFTRNITEYQRISVEKELYDYAEKQLQDIAYPSFTFDISSGNLVFAKESEAYKNELQLGTGVYLSLNDDVYIKPLLIEIHLDYESPDKFELVFSNEYKKADGITSFEDILDEASKVGKTLDMSKYEFGKYTSSGASTAVSDLIQNGLNAAKQSIIAGLNNEVVIDGKGINISSADDEMYIHMNNSMIAFINEDTGDVTMGIGRFKDPNVNTTGTLYGIIAPNIVGTLIAGENLVIENKDINGGNMQFKVDSSGAFLNNSRFYLQKDGGGKIAIDPSYGIAAGTSQLYTINNTQVVPSFVDSNGSLILDGGMPKNTNFFIDLRDGTAYFRGTIFAEKGFFKGTVQASDFLDSSGNSMLTSSGKWNSKYLDLGNIKLDGTSGNITMTGNITMGGNISFTGASSITWGGNTPVKYQFSQYIDGPWHTTMLSSDKYRRDSLDGGKTWGAAYQFKGEDGKNGQDGQDGSDASVTAKNVFNVLTENGTKFGCFYDDGGKLYINAEYIQTGILNASYISLESDDGGFECSRGNDGDKNTYGAKMFGSNKSNSYFFVSDAGCRMTVGDTDFYVVDGQIVASESITQSSDRTLKNNISYDYSDYEDIFFNLKPASFCYNSDQTNRRVLGFIAQDLSDSISKSRACEDNLSLVSVQMKEDEEGITRPIYGIRYTELISLNTHMIQKLYVEIEELKEKINTLGGLS